MIAAETVDIVVGLVGLVGLITWGTIRVLAVITGAPSSTRSE